MSVPPDIRERIYQEERVRLEAQARIKEEIRLRQQGTAFGLRVLLVLVFFSVGYLVSDYFVNLHQAVPEVAPSVRTNPSLVSQAALDEVSQVLKPAAEAEVCARAISRGRTQVRATIELSRDTSDWSARRLAVGKARDVGAILRKHYLALPAYVEVVSPKRWYGVALYDSDTLKIKWDPCPGRCEDEGTLRVQRCSVSSGPGAYIPPRR